MKDILIHRPEGGVRPATEADLRERGWVSAQEIADIIGVAPDEIIPALVAMTDALSNGSE